jgi:hypothetical protein
MVPAKLSGKSVRTRFNSTGEPQLLGFESVRILGESKAKRPNTLDPTPAAKAAAPKPKP